MAQARQCPQCGATVEFPPDRLADRCAFCDCPLVDSTSSAEAIDLVVPFVLPRDRALARLRPFCAHHRLAPEPMRRCAPASLEGVLVPFYVIDGSALSRWAAHIGLSAPGKRAVATWFPLEGTHVATYTGQLVSASRGLPEADANALEPFDLGHAVPYTPASTAGWIAERPDIAVGTADQVAGTEVAARENRALRHGFLLGHPRDVRNTTELSITGVKIALLPVWIASWRHRGRTVRVLVNGQTGEVVGTLPRSRLKLALAAAVLAAPVVLGVLVALIVALLVIPR